MSDIRDSIHKIELSHAEEKGNIDSFLKESKEFFSSMRHDVYSRDGLMDRIGNAVSQLKLQWTLLILVVGSIVGMGLYLLRQ